MAEAEIPRGRVIEKVVCAGDPRQSYALYLPAAYSPDRQWPILYCLDPVARGGVPVERFRQAAERAGFIVAGSNNSRNGSLDAAREAIRWMTEDTYRRFAIDDARAYAAGFSGGARLALSWAAVAHMAGVIACGAGFGGPVSKELPLRVYATAGVDDFNYDEVYAMSRDLSRRGIPQRFADFIGGHDWLPETLTGEALDFLSGRLPPVPPPRESAEQKKVALAFWRLERELESGDAAARRLTIRQLQRDSERPEDTPERRAARRALGGFYVGMAEQGREFLNDKNYAKAADRWGLATEARPKSAEAWYSLAASRAGDHDKRGALEALERAVANGFHDRDRIERDPLFDGLRKEPRYAAVLSSIDR